MGTDWEAKPIADLVEAHTAGFWGSEPAGTEGIRVLRSTNLTENGRLDYSKIVIREFPSLKVEQKRLLRGDILLERSGGGPQQPVGRVAIFDNDELFSFSNFMQRLRPTAGCDRWWLFYSLWNLHATGQTVRMQRATTGIRNLDYAEYLAYPLQVPPLPEQRKIAAILSSVDEAIEKTQAVIDQVQVVKKGLMQELLTRGLPGRHKKFKQTEIGEIPEEWQVVQLGDLIASFIDYRGRTPKKLGMEWGGTIPALSAMNVQDGRIDLSRPTKYGSAALYERWMASGPPEKGDVLLTMEAPLGNVAQIPDDRQYILSQRVLLLRPDEQRLLKSFLFWTLRADEFQSRMRSSSTGTTATGIQRKRLVKLPVALPLRGEQAKISRICDAVECGLNARQAEIIAIRHVKQALMSVLLTGELPVQPNGDTPR